MTVEEILEYALANVRAGKEAHEGLQYEADDHWLDCRMLTPGLPCRIKPVAKIVVNGIEVPAPESTALEWGTKYWTPAISGSGALIYNWDGGPFDNEMLEKGLVYLNAGDAIARQQAMLKFTSAAWTKNEGRMPVDGVTRVEVKLRKGAYLTRAAEDFDWSITCVTGDILEWRLV